MNIPKINFGSAIYNEYEGGGSYVHNYGEVEEYQFYSYINLLTDNGFDIIDRYKIGNNHFAVLEKDGDAVFGAYYPAIGEMRIVEEPQSNYLSLCDVPGEAKVSSTLTQIDLEDYGLSYVIRLNDGRFIVFDGGWEFEPDADKLMKCLQEQSVTAKPVIAAWIMTHAHLDHYRCFFEFHKKYAERVIIERFIYNFADADSSDSERIPALIGSDEEYVHLERFYKIVEEIGAPVTRAHTGNIFTFANAYLEVLSSPDDVFFTPLRDFNTVSLVIKMTIEGQTILWCGDSYYEPAKLGLRWDTYLKSDILQIPHHGFCGGEPFEYSLINPHTCLATVKEDDCFSFINIHMENNRHLIYNLDVQDYYTGSYGDVVLPLPHYPRPNGKKILFDTIEKYEKARGACNWYFDNMLPEDCKFTFIKAGGPATDVYADLYFEDSSKVVRFIKLTISKCVSIKDLFNPEDADPDALYFNRVSLAKLGVTDGVPFTVHFYAESPLIIKGCKDPIYRA